MLTYVDSGVLIAAARVDDSANASANSPLLRVTSIRVVSVRP